MKNYLIIFTALLITSSCDFISKQETCTEFHLKNELSSTVILQPYQIVNQSVIFFIDSFVIAPNETMTIHTNCSLSNIDPYPTGNYAKFTFANNKFKTDTLKSLSYTDAKDTISIYNKNRWLLDYSKPNLKIATYVITDKDSLEAR